MNASPPTPLPARPALSACGSVPVPSGPLTHAAEVVISAPASGRAGADLAVTSYVVARAAQPRVITVVASSAVLVLHDGVVVGRTGGSGTALIPLTLTAGGRRPAQAVPGSVRLRGCHGALPAGRYELIAVLGYRVDSLNSATDGALTRRSGPRAFTLLSAATPVVVG